MEIKDDNREIDLLDVFGKIRDAFRRFLITCYRGVRFILKKGLTLLMLILMGLGLGYLWEYLREPDKSIVVVVYPNVESSSYLFDAVHTLNEKFREGDLEILKAINRELEPGDVKKISVAPVKNISGLVDKYEKYSNEQVLLLLKNIESESFFEADILKRDYELYEIEITASAAYPENLAQNILQYLNDNSYYEKKIELTRQNLLSRIVANNYTIKQLDSLLLNINRSLSSPAAGSIVVAGNNGLNLESAINLKSSLLSQNESAETEILRLETLFKMVNNPVAVAKTGLNSLLKIIFPVVLVILFVGYHLAIHFRKKIENWS